MVYSHGYLETQQSASILALFEAYTKRDQENRVFLDWHIPAGAVYPEAVVNQVAVNSYNFFCRKMNNHTTEY